MTVVDRVLFIFPEDRELKIAAAAVMQSYVNGYDAKMQSNNPLPGVAEFKLEYDVTWKDPEDHVFFKAIDLKLTQNPQVLSGEPDAVFDFSEKRINLFKDSGKHVCQILGIVSGILCSPLPEIRNVKPKADEMKWMDVETFGRTFSAIGSGDVTGVIGKAGWQTYIAAAMGLPTIEIQPEGRPRTWLSKWSNRAYRVVDASAGRIQEQIDQAREELEKLVCSVAAQVNAAA